jgi:hypothetical protein
VQPQDTNEADLTYWKRRVAQQCIYGLDLNPLAVDLAKLSLWLVTVAKDRPLNFLDHHLRTGNALIGSWLAEVAAGQHPRTRVSAKHGKNGKQAGSTEVVQHSMLEDDDFLQSTSVALASIGAIERTTGTTVQEVKAQEAAYEELRTQFSERYLPLANLGAALYYDLALESDVWPSLASYALGKAGDYPFGEHYETWLDTASAIASRKHFFHWELEFPDIFFDATGQPLGEQAGFDAVIGNPPYVRQEALSPDKPYFQQRYESITAKLTSLSISSPRACTCCVKVADCPTSVVIAGCVPTMRHCSVNTYDYKQQ